MSVHIFGKIDSPCIANWVIKDQTKSYSERATELILEHARLFRLVFKSNRSYKYMQRNIWNFEKKGRSHLT